MSRSYTEKQEPYKIQKNTKTHKHKAKAYQSISCDVSCVIAGVRPIQITIEKKVQTYMATKINNTGYDAP